MFTGHTKRIVMWACIIAATGCGAEPEEVTRGAEDSVNVPPVPTLGAAICPAGTLFEPGGGRCAEVHDARASSEHATVRISGLDATRPTGSRGAEDGVPRRRQALPVPGGIGAGTVWKVGQLQASTFGALYTHMVVYPQGVGALSDFLFTTATNRTEKAVEVVGIYSTGPVGEIGIFDWSCMPGYPCQNGSTGAAWIWTKPFTDISCNYAPATLGDGRVRQAMYYVNQSNQEPSGIWRNIVWFWNYCNNAWDIVYTHDYAGPVKDCSVDNSCGWWGPILETFMANPQPPIRELAFFDGYLLHDGTWSSMGTAETDWYPPQPSWPTLYRVPNRSWAVGPIH